MSIGVRVVLLAAALLAAAPLGAQGRPPDPDVAAGEGPPPVTLLYQNFPNPFSPAADGETCIWFDLARDSDVRLEVLDLRGRPVRRILPAAGFYGMVPAGRYGRAASSCVAPFAWDGRDESGRVAANGVYLLRLIAGGERVTRKVILREP